MNDVVGRPCAAEDAPKVGEGEGDGDGGTEKLGVEVVLPKRTMNNLANALVDITAAIDGVRPGVVAHGFLGGEHGYGGHWDSELFTMRPYYWGDCDCGADGREEEWSNTHKHADDCYQSELQRRMRAHGLPYWDDALQEWVGLNKLGYDAEQKIKDGIYRALCDEYKQTYPKGCAVHCTCGHNSSYREWEKVHGHTPACSLELPNFLYKPTGFEVRWYKYIGRSMETKGSPPPIAEMLSACLSSVVQATSHSQDTPDSTVTRK